jgi:23S rRNA (adenine-N6)-dimethyltransferase
MAKRVCKRSGLAQNFLRSRKLVHDLVAASTIDRSDVVYEIGAGRGIVTAELAGVARRVLAFETDPDLVRHLMDRFPHGGNVEIVPRDFLAYRIRDHEYKIFANIPFNLTADIIRKVLLTPSGPAEAGLVMQKEAAWRFSGFPRESRFSLLIKPVYEMQIARTLRHTDFDPIPAVDSVLLISTKRSAPLIDPRDVGRYRRFIRFGFGAWKMTLKSTMKQIFSYPQWKHLARDLGFQMDARPSDLSFEQWLGLFHYFNKSAADHLIRPVIR